MQSTRRWFPLLAAAMLTWPLVAPRVIGGEGDEKSRELIRTRLVEAYERAPHVLDRYEVSKRCDGVETRMHVETYREAAWFGVSYALDDAYDKGDLGIKSNLSGLAVVSDGRELRFVQDGRAVVRCKGPVLYEEDRVALVRAVSELAGYLGVKLASLKPIRTAVDIEVKPTGNKKFSNKVSAMTEANAIPSWLSETPWAMGRVSEDRPGRFAVATSDATWFVRSSDGGLDGWESKYPTGDCVTSASIVPPAWKPEEWQRQIAELLARPSNLTIVDMDGMVAGGSLTESIDLVLAAAPDLCTDAARLGHVADVLVRAFLQQPSISALSPVTLETAWPIVQSAARNAEVEGGSPRQAALLAAFERATKAALAPAGGVVPVPPKSR